MNPNLPMGRPFTKANNTAWLLLGNTTKGGFCRRSRHDHNTYWLDATWQSWSKRDASSGGRNFQVTLVVVVVVGLVIISSSSVGLESCFMNSSDGRREEETPLLHADWLWKTTARIRRRRSDVGDKARLQHDTTQPQLRRQQRRPWIVTNAEARLSFSTNNETRKMDMVHWKRRWMANMLFCLVKTTATWSLDLWYS